MITLNIQSVMQLNPEVAGATAALRNPRQLLSVAAKAVQTLLRAHFLRRNQTPNKNNWPRKNFWNSIRRATAIESITDTQAI